MASTEYQLSPFMVKALDIELSNAGGDLAAHRKMTKALRAYFRQADEQLKKEEKIANQAAKNLKQVINELKTSQQPVRSRGRPVDQEKRRLKSMSQAFGYFKRIRREARWKKARITKQLIKEAKQVAREATKIAKTANKKMPALKANVTDLGATHIRFNYPDL